MFVDQNYEMPNKLDIDVEKCFTDTLDVVTNGKAYQPYVYIDLHSILYALGKTQTLFLLREIA